MSQFLPFVSWGVYTGNNYPQERANYFASWGLWTYSAVKRGLRLVASPWRGVIEKFGYWFC